MMNPNMQIGLLVMLAIHIQAAKKEQFKGVLAKQLNNLSEQECVDVSLPFGVGQWKSLCRLLDKMHVYVIECSTQLCLY
jgi:hypothetical protein